MSRDEIRGNKWLSSLLISLQLFQVVVPSFLGVTKAIASDLPELGSSQAVKGEQSLLAKDMDDYLATQAIRLAAPFNEGTKIDLTDEDTYASKFHSTLSNSQFKSHEENATRISVDSERDYWINQANSLASSYVTTYVDSALSNDFGTVKSVVDLDNELQLSGYSLDALYSLYDDEHNTVFFQSGIRKNSESNRNFFNFGVGHRYVDNTWMIGYNSFFDHELKRGHNRLGFGLEGAADHFKAALNYYHPLSSWKSSVDLDEYEERPAKGIDARLKAYLPSYPQLAATATHEQYFGNEIAIQSANKLEKSPYSSALGIEWTPFPFVTAGLANKWTKNAGSELGIELSFNFKLGSSFSQLFNSSQVLKDRLVTGMRHDLVERNNEIVLQYRKKSSNVAVSHAAIYGQSGQVLQLSPVITGGAEITSWHWRAVSPLGMPDLLQGFNDVSIPSPLVTLPLLPVDTLIAEYTLYLDVTLRNGQVISSEPISTIVHADVAAFERQVKVTSHPNGVINLSSVPVTGVANRSSDPITVEWVLERKLGDTVLSVAPIESVIKTTDPALIVEVQSGRPSDDGGWINAFTLLSNGVKQTREQLLGHVSIQAKSIASLPLVETALDIVADSNPVHFQDATLSIVSNNAVADGSATNSVRAIVVDASGSGLSGQRVSFSADSGATVINTEVVTDEQGVAETTVSSLTPGLSTVTAQLDNGKRAFALISFQESLVPGDFKDHALIVENDGVLADGHMTNVVKATVVDDSDAPMAGLNVSFRASNGAIMQDVVVTTDTQGIARGRLTSLTAGLSTVTAQLDNGKQANASVTFSSDVQITAGNMTVETDNAQADGVAKNKVQVKVTRADGSAVENEPVTFTADNGASLVGSNPVTTDAAGIAVIELTSTVIGQSTVTATLSNGASQSKAVTFSSDVQITAGNMTVETDNAQADGVAKNKVQVKVTRADGSVVENESVTFSADNGASLVGSNPVTTDASGIAVIELTSTVIGQSTVTATLSNGATQSKAVTFSSDVQITAGNMTVEADNAQADGVAKNKVQVKVTRADGSVVENEPVTFTADNGASLVGSNPVTTDASGIAVIELTSTVIGQSTVTATLSNGATQSKAVTFSSDVQITAGNMTVEADNAQADGVAKNNVQVKVTRADGSVVENEPVTFTADNGASLVGSNPVTTDASGIAVIELTSTVIGQSTVTATLSNGATQSKAVTFVQLIPAEGQSTLSLSPATIIANGREGAQLVFMAKNQNGQPVTGLLSDTYEGKSRLEFVQQGVVATLSLLAESSDVAGAYTAQVTGLQPGQVEFVPVVDGKVMESNKSALELTAWLVDEGQSSYSLDKSSIIGDGIDAVTATFVAKDSEGQLVTGLLDSNRLSFPLFFDRIGITGCHTGDLESPIEVSPGTYTTRQATNCGAGRAESLPMVDDVELTSLSQWVEVTAVMVSEAHSVMEVAPPTIVADGVETARVTFTARDANDNPVIGLVEQSRLRLLTKNIVAQVGAITETAEGVYQADISGTQAGLLGIVPQVDGVELSSKSIDVTLKPEIVSVAIQGRAKVNQTLQAIPTCANQCVNLNYQWQVQTVVGGAEYTDIPGAITESFTVTTDLQRRKIRVLVSKR